MCSCNCVHCALHQFGFCAVWSSQGGDYGDTVVWDMLLCSLVDILPFALLLKKWSFIGPLFPYYVSPNFPPPPIDSFRAIICPRHYHLKNAPLNGLCFFWLPSTSHWLLRTVISPVHLPLETSPLEGPYLFAVLTLLVSSKALAQSSLSLCQYNFFQDRFILLPWRWSQQVLLDYILSYPRRQWSCFIIYEFHKRVCVPLFAHCSLCVEIKICVDAFVSVIIL
jgi:hypothetical protein